VLTCISLGQNDILSAGQQNGGYAVGSALDRTGTARFVAFAKAPRSRVDTYRFDRNLFFGQPDSDGPGPQAYINDLDPGVQLAAHFHKVDQYQVFFGKPGATYKHRSIPDVLLHYTDAYSTYGPFSSGPDARLQYATLRAQSSNYGGVMPGAKDQLMRRGGLRNLTVEVPLASTERGEAAAIRSVLEPAPDGLQAFTVSLPPGGTATVPASPRTSGRYFCVLSGELDVDGQLIGAHSLGWAPPACTGAQVRAGAAGCYLLVMDFPSPSTPETIQQPADQERSDG
jgi:hypothetical protein